MHPSYPEAKKQKIPQAIIPQLYSSEGDAWQHLLFWIKRLNSMKEGFAGHTSLEGWKEGLCAC